MILFLLHGCSAKSQKAEHNYTFINNKDTAFLKMNKYKDTILFQINVKSIHNKAINYSFTIIEQLTNKKVPFLSIEKDVDGKPYYSPVKDSSYYADKRGNIQSVYSKMVNERNAFILNRTGKYKCLSMYGLQKNSYWGILKMGYSPSFGPLSLYLNTNGEETDSNTAIAMSFKLVNVDGEKLNKYIKRFCP